MKLKKLFKGIPITNIKGSKDIEITGISSDSRYVSPGSLFIAKKGSEFDGSKFILDAINAGAKAIVTDIYDPFLNVCQVIVKDVNQIEALIACKYYNYPSKKLFSVGITGTNGKTTTSYLIKHILDSNNIKCGLIGTVEYFLGNSKVFSTLTTPSNVLNQKYLKEMIHNKCEAVCMETSSHGLSQNRLDYIDFDVGIFTNLTLDHLDYHKTFENYLNAKKKLFDNLNKKSVSVVNIDDKNYEKLIKDSKSKIVTISVNKKADLQAVNIRYSLKGTYFDVIYKNKSYNFFTSLIGHFNVYNCLSAIAVGIIKPISLEKLKQNIKSFSSVPGRLERIKTKKPFHIFVDHAHTDDAMKNVLSVLNNIKKNKIINVFGCGGNRDKSKRQKMAKASEKYSDVSIVTSDNPRSEDPNDIINEIVLGFSKNTSYIVKKDRKQAIEKAISLAKKDDIIIISGKGHETYQIFADRTIAFDDREIAKNIANSI